MAEPIPRPAWCVEQAEAYVVRNDWAKRPLGSVNKVRIDRVTATTVRTSDGRTWRGQDLRVRQGGAWDATTFALLPLTSGVAADALLRIEHAKRMGHARQVTDDWRTGRGGVTPLDVIVALAPLTGLADQIATLIEEARRG